MYVNVLINFEVYPLLYNSLCPVSNVHTISIFCASFSHPLSLHCVFSNANEKHCFGVRYLEIHFSHGIDEIYMDKWELKFSRLYTKDITKVVKTTAKNSMFIGLIWSNTILELCIHYCSDVYNRYVKDYVIYIPRKYISCRI